MIITYSEWVFVPLGIRHAMRLRHIVIRGLSWNYNIFPHYLTLIKTSLLYGSETWRLTENNKRRVEATEMDALR
jgi:hypothetical protein